MRERKCCLRDLKKLVFLVDAMDLTETEKAAFAVLFEKNETETKKIIPTSEPVIFFFIDKKISFYSKNDLQYQKLDVILGT